MPQRKGLGKGLGQGYKNITPPDPAVHSLSARGVKQQQSLKPMTQNKKMMPKGNLTIMDKWKELPKDWKKDVADLEKEIDFLKADDERLRKRSFTTSDRYALKGINSERNGIWRKIENRQQNLDELKEIKLSKKQVAFLKKNFRGLGDQKKVDRIFGATTRVYEVKLPEGKFQVDSDYIYGAKGSPRFVTIKRAGKK